MNINVPSQKTLTKAVNFLTPNKTITDYFDTNDTTVSNTKPLTTKSMPFSTPRSKSSMSEFYESSIHSPVKKIKRRDCTPDSPIREESNTDMTTDNNFSFMMTERKERGTQSRFMESIEKVNISTADSVSIYTKEAEELLSKIKGTYLLDLIDADSGSGYGKALEKCLFQIAINDNGLFNGITNLICYSFFEGFNTRQDLFFKFMVNIYLN
jgi:hypothetical protein